MKIFHNEELQRLDIADDRFYTTDNVNFYPSVTTILDVYPKGHGFHSWLQQVGFNSEIIVARAGEQGSKIHDAIDFFLNAGQLTWLDEKGKTQYTFEEWQMICRFMEWYAKYKPVVIANEVSMVDEELEFGGTIDLVCEIEGKRWLIDYKSSNAIYTTYELQVAAYATLWEKKNPEYPIDEVGILWLKSATRGEDKKEKKMQGKGWTMKCREDFGRDYKAAFGLFKHCQAIWREENPNYKPKTLTLPDRFKLSEIPTTL